MVKGQIAAGGRGKAGIIRKAATLAGGRPTTPNAILGATVKGRVVEAVRIEQQVTGAEEAYIGLLLDAAAGGVRVIMSAQGGMDVESLPPERHPLRGRRARDAARSRRASSASPRRFDGPDGARRCAMPASASRACSSSARRC